jgi:hypothetical protein
LGAELSVFVFKSNWKFKFSCRRSSNSLLIQLGDQDLALHYLVVLYHFSDLDFPGLTGQAVWAADYPSQLAACINFKDK